MCEETVTAYSKAESQNSMGRTEENYRNINHNLGFIKKDNDG
jgi:hypothetical protein